jgi:hypothetical protein
VKGVVLHAGLSFALIFLYSKLAKNLYGDFKESGHFISGSFIQIHSSYWNSALKLAVGTSTEPDVSILHP